MNSITIFNAKKSTRKFAWSPYDDKTFIFETYHLNHFDNQKMFNILVHEWILNIPLTKLEKPIRTYRRKKNLDQYYPEYINYFVLDLDKVSSKDHQEKILEYFSIYKCIIGESKSYNGIDNFNMKGILYIEPIKLENAKQAISNLNFDLKEWCEVDEAVARKASLNAPIGKNKVLLDRDKILFQCKFDKKINKIENGYIELEKRKKTKIDIDNITGNTIEEFCLNVFKEMLFEPIDSHDNGSITFKHPTEQKSIGGYFWFNSSPYTMHHNNSTKTINIYDAVRKSTVGRELLKEDINYDDAFLHFNTATELIKVHEKYLKVKGKEESIQRFLENPDGLYSIKSPMGTAKSTIIEYIIQEAHELDMRVLIITNRISVAHDFGKKYDMKVYNKDIYNFNDSMIVQFDSLWKYNLHNFDLVIMDEFISLMSHSRNNLGNSSLNIAKFFAAFRKKLVIADAFLTGYENFLLQNKTSNVFQLYNTYRDKTVLYSYVDKNYYYQSLLLHAKKHKITISGTSLKFLHSTKLLLEKHGLKVVLLTASTPDSTKELIYKLFEKNTHDKWDVFMYSPSLTVGVSNLNEVPYHFHFDTSMSTDVISSIQMIKRTRKAREIHMFITERINYVKTNYNDVRDEYIHNIGKNIDQNFLFDVDNYGESKLSYIGINAIKIDTFKNILEFNHKEAMLWMMKYHFFSKPREVTEKFQGNILVTYSNQIKKNKTELIEEHINDYLSLNEIEKMDILMGAKSSTVVMSTLASIEDALKPCNPIIKTRILNLGLKNSNFIERCKKFKVLKEYTDGFITDADIKTKISNAMLSDKSSIPFFVRMLKRGQEPVKDVYEHTPEDNLYKLLVECGYKKGPKKILPYKDAELMAESEKYEYLENIKTVLRIEPDIKELYEYVKD